MTPRRFSAAALHALHIWHTFAWHTCYRFTVAATAASHIRLVLLVAGKSAQLSRPDQHVALGCLRGSTSAAKVHLSFKRGRLLRCCRAMQEMGKG